MLLHTFLRLFRHSPAGYACLLCIRSMNMFVTLYNWPIPFGLNFVVALQGSPTVLIVEQLSACEAIIAFSCRSRSSLIARIRFVRLSWQSTGHHINTSDRKHTWKRRIGNATAVGLRKYTKYIAATRAWWTRRYRLLAVCSHCHHYDIRNAEIGLRVSQQLTTTIFVLYTLNCFFFTQNNDK